MNAIVNFSDTDKYARVIKASKIVHWEIEPDVIKGRTFDLTKKYLPDGLSLVPEMSTLSDAEKRPRRDASRVWSVLQVSSSSRPCRRT